MFLLKNDDKNMSRRARIIDKYIVLVSLCAHLHILFKMSQADEPSLITKSTIK